ncbi:MAG TPA: lytic transglycosylase domain-containing protein [Blastocatellia bacterium]|nr:lytic transglycosylase domain-containing protein [Blastocatellia bacterium]
MKYPRENDFDAIINEAGAAWNVKPALLKGIIAAESEFNPRAYRDEPTLHDGSYGLMQLLYGTANRLGYTGSTTGLFDPTLNVRLGTRFLSDLIRTADRAGYGVDSAISAYNAGSSNVRPGDGQRVTNAPGAPFVNQPYVDKVVSLANYYAGIPQLQTVTVNAIEHVPLSTLLAAAVPLVILLFPRKRKH